MNTSTSITNMENGRIHLLTATQRNVDKIWNAHNTFQGVFLKHIITGEQTDHRFSAHIVKIEPGCILDEHIHEGRTELHEIMEGSGTCMLNGKTIQYVPGDCAVIPENIKHKVIAGNNGLILLAKFIPALL